MIVFKLAIFRTGYFRTGNIFPNGLFPNGIVSERPFFRIKRGALKIIFFPNGQASNGAEVEKNISEVEKIFLEVRSFFFFLLKYMWKDFLEFFFNF